MGGFLCGAVVDRMLTPMNRAKTCLKVYNWADYIGEGVLEDFRNIIRNRRERDIRIVYQTFDINEIMLTKIGSWA